MTKSKILPVVFVIVILSLIGGLVYDAVRIRKPKEPNLVPSPIVSADRVFVTVTGGQTIPLPAVLKFLECKILSVQGGTSTPLPADCVN